MKAIRKESSQIIDRSQKITEELKVVRKESAQIIAGSQSLKNKSVNISTQTNFTDEAQQYKNEALQYRNEALQCRNEALQYRNEIAGIRDEMLEFKAWNHLLLKNVIYLLMWVLRLMI